MRFGEAKHEYISVHLSPVANLFLIIYCCLIMSFDVSQTTVHVCNNCSYMQRLPTHATPVHVYKDCSYLNFIVQITYQMSSKSRNNFVISL